MGEKDITEKILEDHNDVFADIINGLIFAGEQRILPESLENTAVHSQYKADDEKVHELERDVAKYWKDQDVQLAICGIEKISEKTDAERRREVFTDHNIRRSGKTSR